MRLIIRFAVVALVLCATSPVSLAGAQTGAPDFTIRGVVVDTSHAPIAGARVEVSSVAQPQPVTATTDQTGTFTLHVAQGQYHVRITATGLSPLQRDVTAASPGLAPTEFVLKIPELREDVTVSAKAGYQAPAIRSATKTATPLVDVPQSVSVVTSALIKDQMIERG